MGHENVGTIEEIGDVAARRWGVRPGDRVALHEYLPCWHCHWCRQGDFRLCEEADFFLVKDRFRTLRFGLNACDFDIHSVYTFAPSIEHDDPLVRHYQLMRRYQPFLWAVFRRDILESAQGVSNFPDLRPWL